MLSTVTAIEIANGNPIGLTKLSIDTTDHRLDARALICVLRYVRARRDRNLDQRDLAAPLGKKREETTKSNQSFRNSFGVVKSIYAEHQLRGSERARKTG